MDCSIIDDKDNAYLNPIQNSINDIFPNEILEEIFSKLSQPGVCRARLVCQRWKVVVDEVIGHRIAITSFSALAHFFPREETRKFVRLDLKTINCMNRRGLAIRELTLGSSEALVNENLLEVINHLSKGLENLPVFSFPHVLQRFSSFEPVCSDILTCLTPLTRLKYLNISLLSLSSLEPDKSFRTKTKRIFPSLITLIISDTPNSEFDSSTAIPQLNRFLEIIKVPRLSHLDVCCPVLSLLDVSGDSTQHVMNFMKESSKTLRKLSITIWSPSPNFIPPSKWFQYPKNILEEMKALGKNMIHLTSVELKDNHLHSIRPSTHVKAWMNLIKELGNLKKFKLYLKSAIEFKEDVAPILLRNAGTLITLDISCFPCEISVDTKDVYFIPLDCGFLSNCLALESLSVSDKMVRTEFLPKFLKYVYVDAMLTNEDAHNLICSELHNLEKLELKDIRGGSPKGYGSGIKIQTLKQFIINRKVRELMIYAGCTDGKFPPRGIPNGDLDYPKILSKWRAPPKFLNAGDRQREWDNDNSLPEHLRIHWRLNKRGYYETPLLISQFDKNVVDQVESGNVGMQEMNHQLFKCENLFFFSK